MREIALIEHHANNTVDEINKVQEKIKILMQVNLLSLIIHKFMNIYNNVYT